MIQLKNIKKNYTSRKGVVTRALNDLSVSFPSRGLVFILGKSGSGKSTLMNILGGLDTADSGEFIIEGKNIEGLSQVELDHYRNAHVGFVFQDFNIIETFSIYENIGLALQLQGQKASRARIDEILEFVGLKDYGKRKGNEISGGQKQRIAVARALIKKPRIILADEPTGNLDSKTSDQIMQLLKEVSKTNLVVIVSHDPEEAELYADRIIKIKDGKLAEDSGKDPVDFDHQPFSFVHQHLGFWASFKYGIHSISRKKGQMLITTFVIAIAMLFAYLLGSYLGFVDQPNPVLLNSLSPAELAFLSQDLQGYLPSASAFQLNIAMYVILVAVNYVFLSMSVMQRKKQIGIFKALGGNTHDILRIFIWEGVVIALFSWILATYLGYAYVLDINIKFFNTLPVLVFNWFQAGLNLILIFTVSISFIILTVMGILKNNSVISILKK